MSKRPSTRGETEGELPSRRRLLQLGGSLGLVALSGCTEDVGEELPPNTKWPTAELAPELPLTDQTDVLEERIEAVASRTITDEEEFASAFDEYALEVESVGREQDVLTVEYVNTDSYAEGNIHDIAPLAGAYAAIIDGGFDTQMLGITVLNAAPAAYGSAHVTTVWAERYNSGAISAAEYGELVMTTVESQRHPPDVDVSPDE